MELLSHLLGLITQQRQASLYGLAGLRETRVQEGLVLGHLHTRVNTRVNIRILVTCSIEILVSLTAFSLISAAVLFSVTEVSSTEICRASFSILVCTEGAVTRV